MEVLTQFLDAGGMAVIGAAIGAGLAYLFGTLNRRHHEQREDRTRWYVSVTVRAMNYICGVP
jgi:hypothetical protein